MNIKFQEWSLEDVLSFLFGEEAEYIVQALRGNNLDDIPESIYKNKAIKDKILAGYTRLAEEYYGGTFGDNYLPSSVLDVGLDPVIVTRWLREEEIFEELYFSEPMPKGGEEKITSIKESVAEDFNSVDLKEYSRADYWSKTEFYVLLFGKAYSDTFFPFWYQEFSPYLDKNIFIIERFLIGAIERGDLTAIPSATPFLLSKNYHFMDDGDRFEPIKLLTVLDSKGYPVPDSLIDSIKERDFDGAGQLLKKLCENMFHILEAGKTTQNDPLKSSLNTETVASELKKLQSGHQEILFLKKGQFFEVGIKDEPLVQVNAIDGMKYIDYLLRNPGKKTPCLILYYEIKGHPGEPGVNNPYSKMTPDQLGEHNLPAIVGLEEECPIILKHDLAKLLKAKKILEEKYDALEAAGDTQSKIEQEGIENQIEALKKQLGRDTNHLGKSRRFPTVSDGERARSNVSKAIKSAIKNIKIHSPRLGKYLDDTIQLGREFLYLPSSIK